VGGFPLDGEDVVAFGLLVVVKVLAVGVLLEPHLGLADLLVHGLTQVQALILDLH